MTLFIDTSGWYAAADLGDASNARMKQVLATDEPKITTDHVLVESWYLLRARLGRSAADRYWSGIRASAVTVECVTLADLEQAHAIGVAFPDQDWSIVDRTSFVVMERLRLDRVVSLDIDFAVYRYGPHRQRAFVVVR